MTTIEKVRATAQRMTKRQLIEVTRTWEAHHAGKDDTASRAVMAVLVAEQAKRGMIASRSR